jgi:hypothetical protein
VSVVGENAGRAVIPFDVESRIILTKGKEGFGRGMLHGFLIVRFFTRDKNIFAALSKKVRI